MPVVSAPDPLLSTQLQSTTGKVASLEGQFNQLQHQLQQSTQSTQLMAQQVAEHRAKQIADQRMQQFTEQQLQQQQQQARYIPKPRSIDLSSLSPAVQEQIRKARDPRYIPSYERRSSSIPSISRSATIISPEMGSPPDLPTIRLFPVAPPTTLPANSPAFVGMMEAGSDGGRGVPIPAWGPGSLLAFKATAPTCSGKRG